MYANLYFLFLDILDFLPTIYQLEKMIDCIGTSSLLSLFFCIFISVVISVLKEESPKITIERTKKLSAFLYLHFPNHYNYKDKFSLTHDEDLPLNDEDEEDHDFDNYDILPKRNNISQTNWSGKKKSKDPKRKMKRKSFVNKRGKKISIHRNWK